MTLTERPMSIAKLSGKTEIVNAFVVVDFFVADRSDVDAGWTISHAPSGLLVAHSFADRGSAVQAAEQIQRLRNDWSVLSSRSDGGRSAVEVKAICDSLGGIIFIARTNAEVIKAERMFSNTLNGYGKPNP